MSAVTSLEAVNGAGEMWKRLQIAAPLEVRPIEDRRKAHDVGPVGRAERGDGTVHALDGVLEFAAAAVHPRYAGRDQKAMAQQLIPEPRCAVQMRSVAATSVLLAHEKHGGIGREDAIVADHERGAVGVAQMASDRVRRVAPVPADPADCQRAAHDLGRHARRAAFRLFMRIAKPSPASASGSS